MNSAVVQPGCRALLAARDHLAGRRSARSRATYQTSDQRLPSMLATGRIVSSRDLAVSPRRAPAGAASVLIGMARPQSHAHAVRDVGERRASRGCRACGRPAGRTRSTSTMRPGRGDITTMRVERNTASGIEWVTKTTVLLRALPEPQQLLVQLVAGDLVERAERLVHQQELGLEAERARDRDALLHAARQLPGELALEARRARPCRDSAWRARRALARPKRP